MSSSSREQRERDRQRVDPETGETSNAPNTIPYGEFRRQRYEQRMSRERRERRERREHEQSSRDEQSRSSVLRRRVDLVDLIGQPSNVPSELQRTLDLS